MISNLTAKVLFTTLTLCSAVVSPALAQMYPGTGYPAPNPGAYPGTGYPVPSPGAYPSTVSPTYRPPTQTSTVFICGRVGNHPATLVQFNGQMLRSPLIVFQTASDNLTPQQRCNNVSQRMTAAVAQNGGRLSGLLLTTGKVNNQAVICFVNTAETCNSSNVILTLLRPENARNAGNVLARIVRFGRHGGGINVLENGGLDGVSGLDVEPAAVSLEEAVNQLASESGSLEPGATAPSYNQEPGGHTPDPSAGPGGGI